MNARRTMPLGVAAALVVAAFAAAPVQAAPPDPSIAKAALPDSLYYLPSKTTGRRLDWAEFAGNKRLAGEVLPAAKGRPGAVLKVVNKTGIPRTYVLGVFEDPKIESSQYVVTGRVRHQKVAKSGYLEMWSVFPDGSSYFTRTLADDGPMARLAGNSEWRDVALPFDASGSQEHPVRLVVQLVLTANGSVELGPLDLKEQRESAK